LVSFQTKYGESVARVLAAYEHGPALVAALETLISTACANAKAEVRDDFAERVCEGMHAGPAAGLKCLKCYLAEMHFNQEAIVRAEIDNAGSAEPSVPETDTDGEV
jgi:hypothetical protein